MALSFSALLAAAITAFEHFFPWEDELPRPTLDVSYLSMHAWSPLVSGALVGALQVSKGRLPCVKGPVKFADASLDHGMAHNAF